MYNIAYCFDKTYRQHFGASLMSLIKNAGCHGKLLNIYVITDKSDVDLTDKINDIKSNCAISVHLKEIGTKYCELLSGFPRAKMTQFSSAIYFRLFLPSLIPDHVDKILYLDCDTILINNCIELFHLKMDGVSVAAVKDYANENNRRRLGIDSYINSGVMLLNLDKWRNDNITNKCIEWLLANPEDVVFGDQCAINAINNKTLYLLDERWNRYVLSGAKTKFNKKNASILHFIGADKPWHSWFENAHCGYYWKYLKASPWNGARPVPPRTVSQARRRAGMLVKRGRLIAAARIYAKIFSAVANNRTVIESSGTENE